MNSSTISSLLRACKFFPYRSKIFYHQISYAHLTDPKNQYNVGSPYELTVVITQRTFYCTNSKIKAVYNII